MWRRSQDGSATAAAKDMAEDAVGGAKAVTKSAKGAIKSAEEKARSS